VFAGEVLGELKRAALNDGILTLCEAFADALAMQPAGYPEGHRAGLHEEPEIRAGSAACATALTCFSSTPRLYGNFHYIPRRRFPSWIFPRSLAEWNK
jgi:hypothetical protein